MCLKKLSVQQRLQDPKMSFKDVALNIKFFQSNHRILCSNLVDYGKTKCVEYDIS